MTTRQLLETLGLRLDSLQLGQDLVQAFSTLLDVERGNKYFERRWFIRLAQWLLRAIDSFTDKVKAEGISSAMTWIKDALTHLRACALDAGKVTDYPFPSKAPRVERRRMLVQASRCSRSLRAATGDKLEQAAQSHKEILTSPFKTPEPELLSFREYVRAKTRASTVQVGEVSASASLDTKGSGGGSLEEVRGLVDSLRSRPFTYPDLLELDRTFPHEMLGGHVLLNRPKVQERFRIGQVGHSSSGTLLGVPGDQVLFLYDQSCEISLDEWEFLREQLFAIVACVLDVDLDSRPACRQCVIAERGWKTRVVTPISAASNYLLTVANKGLLSIIGEHRELDNSQRGRPCDNLDWSFGKRYALTFSADLKSATDYMPHDLCLVAAEELTRGWPAYLRRLVLRSVGSYDLRCLDGGTVETRRGILMGVPTSWPILSLYSGWLHYRSSSDGWFAVCGDDYLGCHTYASYHKYLRARERTGAKGSPGKDILSTESTGIFAEELVTVGRCRVLRTVPIRPLTGIPKGDTPSWAMGEAISVLLSEAGFSEERSGRLVSRRFGSEMDKLRRAGIDPKGPRWALAGGFPGKPGPRVLETARRVLSQGEDTILGWLTALGIAWSDAPSRDLIQGMVRDKLGGLKGTYPLRIGVGAEEGCVPVSEVVGSLIGRYSFAGSLASPRYEGRRGLTLNCVSRKIAAVRSEVLKRGYWLKAGSAVRDRVTLLGRVDLYTPAMRSPALDVGAVYIRLPLPGEDAEVGLALPDRVAKRAGGQLPLTPRKRVRLSTLPVDRKRVLSSPASLSSPRKRGRVWRGPKGS